MDLSRFARESGPRDTKTVIELLKSLSVLLDKHETIMRKANGEADRCRAEMQRLQEIRQDLRAELLKSIEGA